MKTFILYISFLLSFTASYAQSWQWGRSGGTSETQNPNSVPQDDIIKTMVADSNGNTYAFANVCGADLVIDGVPRTVNNYNYFGYESTDGLLVSYDCNGNFRWYKALGTWYRDNIKQIGIDAQNNIYVLAEFDLRGYDLQPAIVHLGGGVYLPDSPTGVNLNKERVFLIKYNSDGVLQWYKSPQPANVPGSGFTWFNGVMRGLDLQVDPQGNSYILARLGFGAYCGGAYVTPTTAFPQNHILKYDSAGNFVSGNLLAYNYDQSGFSAKFKRNHNNGKFYIVGTVNGSEFAPDPDNVYGTYLGGQYYSWLDFRRYVAEFNTDGTFSWLRHSNPKSVDNGFRDIGFDSDNNVYLAAGFFGVIPDIEGDPVQIDAWNGQPFELSPNPFNYSLTGFCALIKMNPNGDTIWQTNSSTINDPNNNIYYGGGEVRVQIEGDEVLLPYSASSLKWQNITNINPAGNTSARACIKRFNKNTGQIIGADFLDGIPNTQSVFGASCIDSKGNIYGGGFITSSVVVNGVTLNSNGGPNDFFIAKFGSANCDFLATTQQNFEETEVFPNPVSSVLNINNYDVVTYVLYTNLGAKVQEGSLDANGKINMEALAKGIYLLQTKNANGNIKTDKVLKE